MDIEAQLLAVLSLGFFLGLKHATDADHVVAVTTFVTRQRSVFRSCWIGVFWGLGHTISLTIAGLMVIGLKVNISHLVESRLEMLVAIMLVVLGVRVLVRHSREVPLHVHGEAAHAHFGWTQFGIRPLIVGMVHGAAGSAALMLLALSTIRSPIEALAYIVIFGLGSIVGMFAISLLLALPVHWAASRAATSYRGIQLLAGAFSCLFGISLGIETWLN